jgi:hypothetical protein
MLQIKKNLFALPLRCQTGSHPLGAVGFGIRDHSPIPLVSVL